MSTNGKRAKFVQELGDMVDVGDLYTPSMIAALFGVLEEDAKIELDRYVRKGYAAREPDGFRIVKKPEPNGIKNPYRPDSDTTCG